jgi:hypothetical protein
MRIFQWLFVVMLLATGFVMGTVLWQGYSAMLQYSLPHREVFELDPQGRGENLGRDDCKKAGRIAYIDDDGFYLECLRERAK